MICTFISGGEALTGGGTGASYTYQYTKSGQLKTQTANHTTYQFEPPQLETVVYAVNSLNQYTTVGAATLAYDDNGNLTGDGTDAFTYDAENRLTAAAMGGGVNAAYVYDPIGRRVSKTVDGVATGFQELLRPAVILALGDPLPPAQFGDRVLSAQAFQNNADLFFCRIASPGLAADITYMALGRLTRPGILAHLRSLRGYDEPEFLP